MDPNPGDVPQPHHDNRTNLFCGHYATACVSSPNSYIFLLGSAHVFFRSGVNLGDRPASQRFQRFICVNAIIFNQFDGGDDGNSRDRFLRNFYHFFTYVIGSHFSRWNNERGAYVELNEAAVARILVHSFSRNFFRERMPTHVWPLVMRFLGSVAVYRNPASGRWSRVAESAAQRIVPTMRYANLLIVPAGYDFVLESDVLFARHRPGLGERLANLRFYRFARVNSVIFNHLHTLADIAIPMEFMGTFRDFFASVLDSKIREWDDTSYVLPNPDRLFQLLTLALLGNFGWLQDVPWLLGVGHVGSLVHRNPESGRWSRVTDAEAVDIIARQHYVNLLIVPREYNDHLDGWLRDYQYLRAPTFEVNELLRGPLGDFQPR